MITTPSAVIAAIIALAVTILQFAFPDFTSQWSELGRLALEIVTLLLGMFAGLQTFTHSQVANIQAQGKR